MKILKFIFGFIIGIVIIVYSPFLWFVLFPNNGFVPYPTQFIVYGIIIITSLILFILHKRSIFLGLFIGSILSSVAVIMLRSMISHLL